MQTNILLQTLLQHYSSQEKFVNLIFICSIIIFIFKNISHFIIDDYTECIFGSVFCSSGCQTPPPPPPLFLSRVTSQRPTISSSNKMTGVPEGSITYIVARKSIKFCCKTRTTQETCVPFPCHLYIEHIYLVDY